MTDDTAERLARLRSRQNAQPIDPLLADAPTPRTPRKPRTSPANGTKIAIAGASATAVLGIIAAFGAGQAAAEDPTPVPAAQVSPPAAVAAAPPPHVVVVVLDGSPAGDGTPLATLAPVAAPTQVELAVPEIERPPAPEPQATSEGS